MLILHSRKYKVSTHASSLSRVSEYFTVATHGPVPYPITKDNTGCPPLEVPEGHPRPSMNESWIALVMRGGCGFDEKVLVLCAISVPWLISRNLHGN